LLSLTSSDYIFRKSVHKVRLSLKQTAMGK